MGNVELGIIKKKMKNRFLLQSKTDDMGNKAPTPNLLRKSWIQTNYVPFRRWLKPRLLYLSLRPAAASHHLAA